jgi:hypothetical protein
MILAGLVLGAIGLGYLTIQWLQDTGKQELQIEQLENQIDLRRQIDEADRTSPRNATDADSLLREFLDANR